MYILGKNAQITIKAFIEWDVNTLNESLILFSSENSYSILKG